VSYSWFAVLHVHEWQLLGSAFLGIGLGFGLAAMATLVVQAVAQRQTGIATAINMILRSAGGAIGAQAAAARRGLPAESGYSAAFFMCVGAGVVAWLAAVAVPRPRQAVPGAALA
jgi:hypothetical protein